VVVAVAVAVNVNGGFNVDVVVDGDGDGDEGSRPTLSTASSAGTVPGFPVFQGIGSTR
jgi:hypothetical protein